MSKEILLEIDREAFKGELLDIGLDNDGIVYNMYKQFNGHNKIEYLHGKQQQDKIKKNYYDNCIMLFSFSAIWFKINRREIIKKIHSYLKDNGTLHIWEVNKGYGKISHCTVAIPFPDNKLKQIKITDLNIVKDNSISAIKSIVEACFSIEDMKINEDIFYIKAVKNKEEVVEECREVAVERDD